MVSLVPWYHTTTFALSWLGIEIHRRWRPYICIFNILDTGHDIDPDCLPSTELQRHTESAHSLEQARKWLRVCETEHGECNIPEQDSAADNTVFRPSRLLYLGDPGCVSLHVVTDYPDSLTYMTLSHCWGNTHVARLQKDNLERFRNIIPPEALPKTFEHAIKIARELGSDYLWIDSLCMIQDSIEDWEVESDMMGQIYCNSRCNIRPFLGEYWAGIWERLVSAHLVWLTKTPSGITAVPRCTRLEIKRAPSWS